MLNDLRHILEEDNKIENDLELMMEGTDSDMIDMFIDDDGEAEIPESELNKILTKIPEYNREEELNKRLKRLTESVIPDYDDIVEENTLFEDDDDMLEENGLGGFDDDDTDIVEEGLGQKIKMKRYKNLAKKNVGKCSYYKRVLEESIKKMTSERQLRNFSNSMPKLISQLETSMESVKDDPEYSSYLKECSAYVKWIKTSFPKLVNKRRKELGIDVKKATKESYEFDNDIDIVEESEYVCDMTDIEDLF